MISESVWSEEGCLTVSSESNSKQEKILGSIATTSTQTAQGGAPILWPPAMGSETQLRQNKCLAVCFDWWQELQAD